MARKLTDYERGRVDGIRIGKWRGYCRAWLHACGAVAIAAIIVLIVSHV